MNKKAVVGIIVLVLVAVSAIALINSQFINSQNPKNTSNPHFDMQVQEVSAGTFKVFLKNKLENEYLFSKWELTVTNANESSMDFGKGIQSREGDLNLPPNETIELSTVRSWSLYNNSCLFNIKLTLDNYGTATNIFELTEPTEPYFDLRIAHKENLGETKALLSNRGTETLTLNLTLTVTSGNHGVDSYGNPDNYGQDIMTPFHSDHFQSEGGSSKTLMTLHGAYTLHFNPYIMVFTLTIEGYGTITHTSVIPDNP